MKRGYPILPPKRVIFGGVVFDVRAAPVTVTPATTDTETAAVRDLRTRELLYLGKADGRAVLYDTKHQTALFVALDAVVLEVANCELEAPGDPRCLQVLGRRDEPANR